MRWTDDDIDYLLKHAGIRSATAIAQVLGRDVGSIRVKATELRSKGVFVAQLDDFEVCPVCGAKYHGESCYVCSLKERRREAAHRRDLAAQMREAHSSGDSDEVARINREILASNQAVHRAYLDCGIAPRQSDGQMPINF